MKVYVLVGGFYYEGSTILEIFSTRELAEKGMEEREKAEEEYFAYDYYKIKEYEVADEL